jgi:pyrimidine oxygenase
MAGLAAVTERIKIFATCPTLIIPPAFAARMCNTIDSISHGRFGLNLITGWQPPEYTQMGLWPGDDHFRDRYTMLDEYAQILRELWDSGRSDFKGRYYTMDDCLVRPKPEGEMKIICAGSSDAGLAFSAKWADYAFCLGVGVNTPTAFASNNERLAKALEKTGRSVSVFVLVMIIAAETDEEAMERWQHLNAGVDIDAIAWLAEQGAKDNVNTDTNVRQLAAPEGAVNINMGTLVGSYASVARMLDEMAEVPNTGGVLLTFDDFVVGIEAFGTHIQPLMKSRAHIATG